MHPLMPGECPWGLSEIVCGLMLSLPSGIVPFPPKRLHDGWDGYEMKYFVRIIKTTLVLVSLVGAILGHYSVSYPFVIKE